MKTRPSTFTALPLAIFRAAARRAAGVVAAIVVLLLLSFFALYKTPLASDVTRLIPAHAKKTSLYFDLMKNFGTMEKLYVVFSSDDIRAHLSAIDRVGDRLEALDDLSEVSWRITQDTRTYIRDTLLPKLPLYLDRTDMDEFMQHLSPEGMTDALRRTSARLKLPGGGKAVQDPLGLYESFASRLKFTDRDVDITSGYFITPDGKKLIMSATPARSPRDVSFDRKLVGVVNTILKNNMEKGLKAQVTGSHAITLHEASIVKSEIVKNFFTALISVLLIFMIFLRGMRGMIASILPVLLSIAMTTGIASFLLGAVSEISGGFAGLLIGLGVDLGIVLYIRYMLFSAQGVSRAEALDLGVRSAGPGISAGVLTTAVTFLPMLLSSFRVLRELGILTGVGIVVTFFLLFATFPLLASRRRSVRAHNHVVAGGGFISTVFRFSHSNPLMTFGLTIALTAILALFIPHVHVENDLTRLGSRKNPARDILYELERDYMPKKNLLITGAAPTPEAAAQETAHIEAELSDSREVLSLSDILPSMEQQRDNLARLSSLKADKVIDNFKRAASSLGMRIKPFEGYLKGLRKTLENTKPITFADIKPLEAFTERVLKKEGDGWRFLVTAPDEKTLPKAIRNTQYTGTRYMREELLGLLGRDAVLITAVGLMLVNVILLFSFRRITYVLLCQVPVLVTSLWVLGLMGVIGISFNFMNAIVFVMLFGIGTDYTIHLLHRRGQGGDMDEMARDTGTAVVLAGLTTIAGFGSMALSAYRGMASLGAATALGVMGCVIVSITVIPAFFGLRDRHVSGK